MKNLPSLSISSLNSTPHGGKYLLNFILYTTPESLTRVYYSGHCKQLAPEYAKAAQRLAQANPPQYLAKVDATEQKKLAERFSIRGFPTLVFFK